MNNKKFVHIVRSLNKMRVSTGGTMTNISVPSSWGTCQCSILNSLESDHYAYFDKINVNDCRRNCT